jgi:hypothetical protein
MMEAQMLKWLALAVLLFPCLMRAQDAKPVEKSPCLVKPEVGPPAPPDKKDKKKDKKKVPEDNLIPLGVVVCEVENALDAYQQSKEVSDRTDANKDPLPPIVSADFDFKTVVDTKGTLGIGFYIFKIGGSYDKQTTNDVDFQYVPKSLTVGFVEAKKAVSFQEELLKTITNAAKAIKDEQAKPVPINIKDPLVFKQLTINLSYGVTWDINGGISVPINIITLTASLDRSKNAVQSVKLVFAPIPKKPEKQ